MSDYVGEDRRQNGTAFVLGSHGAKIDIMFTGFQALQRDVREIRTALDERKGERKTLMVLAGVMGTISSVLTAVGIAIYRGR